MNYSWGHTKRYNDYSSYIRKFFNCSVQKISINAGFTCPNRDGSKGTGGCSFCNNDSFKPSYCEPFMDVKEQIVKGISLFRKRHPNTKFLAYFQSYTNTYGDLSAIIKLYEQALSVNGVIGIIIGTRPDCLQVELLDYLTQLNNNKYITVELGVESTLDSTLEKVNRGHTFADTTEAFLKLNDRNIFTGAHLILGLPGETRDQMLHHSVELSRLPVNFLKVHQLQYIKGSTLGNDYQKNPLNYNVMALAEYIDLVIDFLELLSPEIVMERFASHSPAELLLAPSWGLKNFEFVRIVEKRLNERETWQGRLFGKSLL